MMRIPRKNKQAQTYQDPKVAALFASYPKDLRARLMALRQLILNTAATTNGVGELEETLKWGQPSYLTTASGSGSTIRIDRVKSHTGQVAMYFHCQTNLVATFRELYPNEMAYGGNRSILFNAGEPIPEKALRHCIGLALTYHARKSRTAQKSPKPPQKGTNLKSRRARPS